MESREASILRTDKTWLIVERLRNPRTSPSKRLSLAREAWRHSECFVRRVAVECMTALRPRSLVRTLTDALRDDCWEVRVAALEGLEVTLHGRRRSPRAVDRLLQDSSKLVRLQAAETLGAIGDRAALVPLRRALDDRSPLVRRYVAEAIGRLGTQTDVRRLQARIRRERSQSAKVGLWHGVYLLGVSDALPQLFSLLKSRNYAIRSAVAVALQDATRLPDVQKSTQRLREVLRREETPARESMEATLRILERRAHESRGSARAT
jgi:HEAT repeats